MGRSIWQVGLGVSELAEGLDAFVVLEMLDCGVFEVVPAVHVA